MRTAFTLLPAFGLLGMAIAQPLELDSSKPASPPAQLDDPRPMDGEINFDRLRRRVAEARERADRLERALASLEEGTPLREVMEDLRPDERRYFLPWSPRENRLQGANTDRPFGRRPGSGERQERPGSTPDGARTETSGEPPVSPEEIRAFITEHLPQMSQHLEMIEQGNAEAGKRMLGRLSPRIGEVILSGRRDEALGGLKLKELELGLSTIKIAREAREASRGQSPDPEHESNTRQRLRDNLIAQADIRAQIQRREIELLELRIESLRTELAERESERDVVIDEMLDQMMRRMLRPDRSRRGDQAGKP